MSSDSINPREVLTQDRYTPEEISELMHIDAHVIRRAVREGRLPARVVGDDIVDIDRADLVSWLRDRDREE